MKFLIFKVNQLGDNIVFLPVVQELLKHRKPEDIYLFTTPTAKCLYQELLPEDNIFAWERNAYHNALKNPSIFSAAYKITKAIKPDATIVPYDQGSVSRLMSFLSGAKNRYGVTNKGAKFNRLQNHRIETTLSDPMAIQDWSIILQICNDSEKGHTPSTPPPPSLNHIINLPIPLSNKIFIHAGASRAYKQWSLENYISLANDLAEKEITVVWAEQKNEIEKNLSSKVTFFPQKNLITFIQELATCSLFIGNNSGPMNIANALSTPSIIFSGPSPKKWDPYWHQEKTLNLRDFKIACQPCDSESGPVGHCTNEKDPMICMTNWSVDNVIKKSLELLKNQQTA